MDKTKPAADLSRFVGPGSDRPDLAEVLSWTDQLLGAVNALHSKSQPIIHAGISPATVTLDGSGTIHLKTIREASDTQINYKPLEQLWDSLDHFSQRAILNRYDDEAQRWLSQPPTPASDIYSVAATVYAVLTGVEPPDALDRSIAAMEDKKDPLVAPHLLLPSVPPEISDVIMKAMALRRDDRYYSAVILRQVFKTAAVRVRERLENELSEDLPRPAPSGPVLPVVDMPAIAPHAVPAATDPLGVEGPAVETTKLDDVLEVPAEPVEQKVEEVYVPEEAPPVEIESATIPISSAPLEAAIPEPENEPAVMFGSVGDSAQEAPSRSKIPAIAAGVVVLLLAVAGGIYKFSSPGSAVPAPESVSKPAPAAVLPQSEPPATEAAPAIEQPPAAVSAETSTTSPEAGHIEGTRPRQTRAVTAAQTEPAKKAPAPAKTQAPKKQVTVEDLINDH